MRTCSKCSKESGKNSMCKTCKQEYNRKHYLKYKDHYDKKSKRERQRRKDYISHIKQEIGCFHCGIKNPVVLDLHHEFDNKDRNIADYRSIANIIKEINKCIVLCSNCHRIEHDRLR